MKIFLVGGAVRDQLLNIPVKEKDWVVVGASVAEMLEQGFKPVGKDFPVFLHPDNKEEYALARTERKTAPGYQGFHFNTDASVTLEEDLLRRDLTINAIAMDDKGNLIDPYGGQADIQNRILRHVSESFIEDPVRILRVGRFLARFSYLGFTVADETLALMRRMVDNRESEHLVPERIWQEWLKALAEKDPDCFFELIHQMDMEKDVFAGLSTVRLDDATAYLVTMAASSKREDFRFAAWCFGLHESLIADLCDHLRIPNQFKDLALKTKLAAPQLIKKDVLGVEGVAELLDTLDVLRRPERFQDIIDVSKTLLTENKERFNVFWSEAVAHFKNVDPQVLLAKGFEKAALGKAISLERRKNLEQWLAQHE